jgi:hypothetical protein
METGTPGRARRVNIAATCDYWRRELRLLAAALERLIERIEHLEKEVHSCQSAHSSATAAGGGAIYNPDELLSNEPICYNLYDRKLSNGSVEIALDGGEKFKLAPQLAEVFLFIAGGATNPGGEDPLVGWRSRTEILGHLSKQFGRSFKQRYVNNLIHRIKLALAKAHYDRRYIQTNRQKGVRLALARNSALPPETTNR